MKWTSLLSQIYKARNTLVLTGSLSFVGFTVGCSHTPTESNTTVPTASTSTAPVVAGSKKSEGTENNYKTENKSKAVTPRGIDYAYPPARIAFSSGADQDRPQPIWNSILKEEPDLFIFAGNAIKINSSQRKPLAEKYLKLDQIPEYRKFREEIAMLSIWDDNDFGLIDGGRENPDKEIARRDFLSYWSYIRDSISLGQSPLYHAKIIGGPVYQRIEKSKGKRKSRKRTKAKITSKPGSSVQVIMLDTRWNRTALEKNGNQFAPTTDAKATILGSEQWTWLEDQISKHADIKIIVSPLQVIAENSKAEKWANYPKEKERLLSLIRKSKTKNLFIISGNRDFGAIAKTDLSGWGTLYDITAGGINISSSSSDSDPSYLGSIALQENFGLATIDWGQKLLTIQIKDINGTVFNSVSLPLQ